MLQGKFRFSLDGVDATARQFAEVRRQLRELSSTVGVSVGSVAERVTAVEQDFNSLGCDCSTVASTVDAGDADRFVPVDGLRQVKWRVFWLKDELNRKLDDAQPVVGLLADDLDEAGLGFFCEYDGDGNVSGVDYSGLSVAALRLAQEAMDEVDGLKREVEGLKREVAGLSSEKR